MYLYTVYNETKTRKHKTYEKKHVNLLKHSNLQQWRHMERTKSTIAYNKQRCRRNKKRHHNKI